MESDFNEKRLRFFVGDVRDSERLFSALEDVDIVFHTAALKHVPKIEYNPFEAIKTNVIGSQNVIDNSLRQNVKKVIDLMLRLKARSFFHTFKILNFESKISFSN